MKKLTVLSFGGGQDSTALLYAYVYDKRFRSKFKDHDFLVVMADTGDEHPETYRHVKEIEGFCEKHSIKFYFLTNDKGFHSDKWPDLRSFYKRTNTVGSKAFMKTCTDNLKLKPIYRFLETYIEEKYGFEGNRKKGLKNFASVNGKINMILGIAKGEEGRIGAEDKAPKWMQKSIKRIYPLIDMGLDRKGCQDYIASCGHTVPVPSNCMLCPYMSDQELLWLSRFYPNDFKAWAKLERAKLENYSHLDGDSKTKNRNIGVWGKINKDNTTMTLEQALEIAEEKHGHMTDEELEEYKMSHGHCVKTKY